MSFSYDYPPIRPPSEADSALIRVTRGCPWNRCTFCSVYRHVKFESRSLADIEADIDSIPDYFPGTDTVFIGDSNSLVYKDLVTVVKMIREKLPETMRITSYARAHTLHVKTIDQLKELKEAGLDRLHVGLESGDANILENVAKGAGRELMIQGGRKAKEAGMELSLYVLCGLGGEELWQRHADGSAEVINIIKPDFIRLRTLTLTDDTPLYNNWKEGKFKPITPLTRLKETRRLIEKLTVSNCYLASDHVTNYLWAPGGIIYYGVNGPLPKDKEALLRNLDAAIETVGQRDDIADATALMEQGYIQGL